MPCGGLGQIFGLHSPTSYQVAGLLENSLQLTAKATRDRDWNLPISTRAEDGWHYLRIEAENVARDWSAILNVAVETWCAIHSITISS
jgi:hypothetical protein